MEYINKKTQAAIETACVINGGDWVPKEKQPENSKTHTKTTRKKQGEEIWIILQPLKTLQNCSES